MKPRFVVAVLPALLVAGLLAAVPGHASSNRPTFGPDIVLQGSGGAEPSLAIDLSHDAHRNSLYVTGISPGANLWHSYDAGRTFSAPVAIDTNGPERGGDDDVAVGPDGTVYVVDLNVSHNWVQSSADGGKTFTSGTATAFESDRPWITAGQNKTVYVAYHDFAAELPVVCMSTDGGATFPICNDANQGASAVPCAENTDVGKRLQIDPVDGSINFLFQCSSAQENASTPPYGPVHDFYIAKSTDGGVTYSVYPVYLADTSGGKQPTLANFWVSLAVDSAGNYYALMDGTMNDADVMHNPYHVYLLTSKDHGKTWSKPVVVDHESDGRGTHVLSDIVATKAGQVDIVFYGTTRTGEPNGVCGDFAAQAPCANNVGFPSYTSKNAPAWRVSLVQSFDALSAHPHFTQTPVTTRPTHFGELCTNGLVCNKSDRSMLDYISVGVDCLGRAHVAFAGNPGEAQGGKPEINVVSQRGGSRLAPPVACSAR